MTIPLVLYIFQQTSLVAIISSMLVAPLVPLTMLLALVAGVAGSLFTATAGWFAWPARLVLAYMLDTASALAHVPYPVAHYSISAAVMAGMYGLLVVVVAILYRQVRRFDQAVRCTSNPRSTQ